MKDDATYTVTISGPGFSVTAGRGGCPGGLEERIEVALVLGEAVAMVAGRVGSEELMLAMVVDRRLLVDMRGEVGRHVVAFRQAAFDLIAADSKLKREKAVARAAEADDRGGV